jgi:HAD superfamily hydrolase (TIGR01450 family)
VTCWVVDLDGVMWQGTRPVPGSAEAIERLIEGGHRVVFCTNFAADAAAKRSVLDAQGVPDAPVVTAADAAAAMCGVGMRVLVLGLPELGGIIATSGAEVIDARQLGVGEAPRVDAVVLGAHEDWDRSRLGLVADAVRSGARFIVTNEDPTFPVSWPDGGLRLLPGCGALAASVEVASGRTATFAGKPHPPMASILMDRHGPIDWVVGDQPSTDGGLAAAVGAKFALVLTGATAREQARDAGADLIAEDLSAAVHAALGV